MTAILELCDIKKAFQIGEQTVSVLKGVSLSLKAGEIVGLVGQSGAGKSTLLQIAGLLELPTEGSVKIDGASAESMSDYERTVLRRHKIGFVYQSHRLLQDFSALENVILPQIIAGRPVKEAEARGRDLLSKVGLGARLNHRPAKLSGGEQQRVAIIRAMANAPSLLLADEPTGNLDSKTAEDVFKLLLQVIRSQKVAALIATHNPELAERMDRVIVLRDGLCL